MLRMYENGEQKITKKDITGKLGRRRKGNPCRIWLQGIDEIGGCKGQSIGEMKRLIRNRKEWKNWMNEA